MDESHAINLKFMVINYGLLWNKSCEHIRCIGAAGQVKELFDQIVNHKKRITENTALSARLLCEDYMSELEGMCEDRKHDLLLSLYAHGIHTFLWNNPWSKQFKLLQSSIFHRG